MPISFRARSNLDPLFAQSHKPATGPDDLGRIYILGIGGIGKFIAHSLHKHPPTPPITLLFHKPISLSEFTKPENASQLNLTTDGAPSPSGPFAAELVLPSNRRGSEQKHAEEEIQKQSSHTLLDYLIVTVKAQQTARSLRPLKHRLTRDSTILFLQNGCGMIDEVNKEVFPNVNERPHYILGINSHGITAAGTSNAILAGQGVIYLGTVPRSDHSQLELSTTRREPGKKDIGDGELPNTSKHLLRSLTRIPVLAASHVTSSTLTLHQLDKLAVNCVVNPLTVLLDTPNGYLLRSHHFTVIMRLLLHEISAVFRRLPEVQGLPDVDMRFSVSNLQDLVISVTQKTGKNISSMLQDVRKGVETEIDYLNGYIVRRAKEVQVETPVNESVVALVKGKQSLKSEKSDFDALQQVRLERKPIV